MKAEMSFIGSCVDISINRAKYLVCYETVNCMYQYLRCKLTMLKGNVNMLFTVNVLMVEVDNYD